MDLVSRAIVKILSCGPVPQHVAFVMDGNRRFARRSHQPVQKGHLQGFDTLKIVLEMCMRLGVKCVSTYAFSIENFKRPKEEVDALMELATEKIQELCREQDLLSEYGVRLNIIGRKEMLPEELQGVIREAEELTRHHDRAILNLCMPYTSRDEMTSAVKRTVSKYEAGAIPLDDITVESIESELGTSLVGSPPVDMLIRTSGVERLSDYFLWQTSEKTQIFFSGTFWPDFSLWEFVPMLLEYQRKVWSAS